MDHFDIIVIGGGPAGVTAALRASELGAGVALVERARLGGTCTNDGCVPTRVLAKAARLLREAEQFDEYGLSSAVPELDFERLINRTQYIVYSIHEKKQLIKHLQDSDVAVFSEVGAARFVDPHTVALPDGRQLQAEKFILCAGGRARRLNVPGAEHTLSHSDVWSLKRLPASIAIVGGAATGCQLASVFDTFGARVSILEMSGRLVPREDALVSQVLQRAFEERGIEIITPIGGVERIVEKGDRLQLHYSFDDGGRPESSKDLETGPSKRVLEAEAIIAAVGWPGNADQLNVQATGVQTERGFVVVDEYLRTTAPHIFAAGDMTGRMMLVQSGSYEARIAAENAVMGAGQRYQHTIVPHGGFTDPEYASVGLTEEQARAQTECAVSVIPYSDLDRAVIDDHVEGFCKLIVSVESHRMLGVHVVGEQAVEIVQIVAAGMASDMWVEQLAELELAYPTFTSIIGLAARDIVRQLGVMPLAPEWQTLERRHAAEWERSGIRPVWMETS